MSVRLTGLDGSNPLAFMAALGVLCAGPKSWTLRWENDGKWTPVLEGPESMEALLTFLWEDLQQWKTAPALSLSYGGKRDLKAPPEVFLEWWMGLEEGDQGKGLAASFGLAEVRDNGGAVKPNALHFTAGQQQFLKMLRELQEGLTEDDFENALVGTWKGNRTLPSFGWDATIRRDYALRSTDPSKDTRTGVPGADWLAFRSWSLFPVFATRGKLQTTNCYGGWKTGRFRWPLWNVDATERAVKGLFAQPFLAKEARARGITTVVESQILRSDQGGYGSFCPSTSLTGGA